ncbi:hypothetical protein K0M31_009333 [Melipona bicolor]|uniref:Uncharacterized protein n=1 Tax=Melipona bicolor TaxID=60889 RepID=A0AA40KJN1_9HYME|nr:hypothetical protein K0M31_009333 [Melipona bicolor]
MILRNGDDSEYKFGQIQWTKSQDIIPVSIDTFWSLECRSINPGSHVIAVAVKSCQFEQNFPPVDPSLSSEGRERSLHDGVHCVASCLGRADFPLSSFESLAHTCEAASGEFEAVSLVTHLCPSWLFGESVRVLWVEIAAAPLWYDAHVLRK